MKGCFLSLLGFALYSVVVGFVLAVLLEILGFNDNYSFIESFKYSCIIGAGIVLGGAIGLKLIRK